MKNSAYQSPFAKKYVAEGRNEGVTGALLTVLRVRGIDVPQATRERVLAEKDTSRLERWHERASIAASLADVFTDPS